MASPRNGKLTDSAAKVIGLARKARDYYEVEFRKRHPNYPVVGEDEEGPPPPPAEATLRQYLLGLPSETVLQLLLLMYLGRGDFEADELAENYEAYKVSLGDLQVVVSQMMANAPLADYLEDGLEALRIHNINPNTLPPKMAATTRR